MSMMDPPRLLKGRHKWRMILEHFRIADIDMKLIELKDLIDLRMHSNNLRQFQADWNMCLLNQRDPSIRSNVVLLHSLYLTQVENHPALAIEMAEYHRRKPLQTYSWLYQMVEAQLARAVEQRNTNNIRNSRGTAYPLKARGSNARRPCREWVKTGKCSRGDSCGYAHDQSKRARGYSRSGGSRSSGRGSRYSGRSSSRGSRKRKGKRQTPWKRESITQSLQIIARFARLTWVS